MRGMTPLSDTEYDDIRRAFSGRFEVRDRSLFVFGCHTGFRISEILALRTKDVIIGNHPRSVIEVTAKHMKGHRRSRSVPVSLAAQSAIAEWWQRLRTIDPDPNGMFWRAQVEKGKAVSHGTFRLALHTAAEKAGIRRRVSTHTMRKTFATKIFEALGRDLRKTQIALGHVAISSTIHYLLGFEDEVNTAIQGLAIGEQIDARKNQLELFGTFAAPPNVVRFSDASRVDGTLAL